MVKFYLVMFIHSLFISIGVYKTSENTKEMPLQEKERWGTKKYNTNDTSLRKHAYWNILKMLSPKNENFQFKKKSDIFHISARRGGSNEYPQSMFLSRNKKNNVYPCKLQFNYIKVGFKGVKII